MEGNILLKKFKKNFLKLKKYLNLQVKKVRVLVRLMRKVPHQTHLGEISNDQKINRISLRAFRKTKKKK